VLFCRCTPTSDVVLAPTSWRRVAPGARRQLTVKVYRHQRVADDVSVLQLRLPAGQRVKFRAGQYLEVLLDDGSRRSYSMANAPHENDAVTLHIRHIEGGRFSARVPQLQPGDPLRIELPLGSFSLHEDSGRALVFVAGGTGFAPIKSMLDDMVKRGIRRPVTLFWGARDASGLYLLPAVERWQRMLPGFRFVRALSVAAHAQPGDVFRGRLDAAVLAACPTLVDHALYCCGSPAMVAAVREACIAQRGLAASDFHSDAFVSSGTTEMQPTHGSRSA
jgi:CDP-4-dehydro-6-deoxyglucose reductase/terephthalate 1,2-dioxygenase reductase component